VSELVLSASSVDAYASCHYRWYLAYVESTPGEQGIPQAVGLGVHAAAEDYYNAVLRGDKLSSTEVLAAGRESFDLMFMVQSAEISEPSENPLKARKEGQRVTEVYLTDVAPHVNPVYVELPGRVVVNEIPYSFHVDLVDDLDVVRDLKVKRAMPRYGLRDYLFAGIGYALGFREESGRVETDYQLDIMIRLKRDRPYYRTITHGGPFSDYEIGEFAARLERVADGIARARFDPSGLDEDPYVCRYCPVQALCAPYQETHPEENARAYEDD
jgi:PD-(D/E)XK nuclease superfamily